MHIGILGLGDVGRTLGAGLAGHGHEVMLGTRDPSAKRIRDWVKETGHSVRAGTFAEAAQSRAWRSSPPPGAAPATPWSSPARDTSRTTWSST